MKDFLLHAKKMFSLLLVAAVAVTSTPFFAIEGETYASESDISPIIQLEAGYGTSALLLEDGSLWMWGCNTNDQIGIYTDGKDVMSPYHVKSGVIRVELFSGGYTRALTSDGVLWEWGGGKEWDARTPHFEATPRKVIDNAVQFSGNLVLLQSGKVVTIKRTVNETSAPIKDEFKPEGISGQYNDGSANKSFSYGIEETWNAGDIAELVETDGNENYGAISDQGKVFTWGSNSRGQLGLYPDFTWRDCQNYLDGNSTETVDYSVPEPSEVICRNESDGAVLNTPKFVKAVIGEDRSAFLTDNGDLYFAGQYHYSKSWSSYVFSSPHYAASGFSDLFLEHGRIFVKDAGNRVLCYGGFDPDESEADINLFDEQGAALTGNTETMFEDCVLFSVNNKDNNDYSGAVYMLATKNDGSLWVRGANAHGQLGLGDTDNRDEWVSGSHILKAIYNEDANVPGAKSDSSKGYINETGKNPGETWGTPLVWGRDTFSFTNEDKYFGQTDKDKPHQYSTLDDIYSWTILNGSSQPYSYYIGADETPALLKQYESDPDSLSGFFYYDKLAKRLGTGFNTTDLEKMRDFTRTHNWTGCCYGMSSIAAWNFRGGFSIPNVDAIGNAKTLYELAAPYDSWTGTIRKNQLLKDEIGFWQSVAASVSYDQLAQAFSEKSVIYRLTYLVQELKKNQKAPLQITFNYVINDSYLNNDDPADDKKAFFVHSVLACALETENGPYEHDGTEYEYRVRIIDPNLLYNEKTKLSEANKYCIYITKDCRHFYFPAYNFSESTGDPRKTGEGELNVVTTAAPLTYSLRPSQMSYDVLNSNSGLIRVNGSVCSASAGAFDGLAGRIFVPSGDEPPMNINTNKDLFPEVEIMSSDDKVSYYNNGTLTAVAADKGSSIRFEPGGAELSNPGGEFTIKVTADEGINNLDDTHYVIVSGKGKRSIDIQKTEETVVIGGKDLDGIHVEINGKETTLNDTDTNKKSAVELILLGDEIDTSEHYYGLRTVEGAYSRLKYTGKTRHPKLTPIGSGEVVMQEGRDYKIIWPRASVIIGKHYAKIHFIGKYSDVPDEKVLYLIVPGKEKIKKLTSGSRAITVRYSKVKGAEGYQIAIRKKGTTKWKKYKVKGYKKVSKTIKKLKKGKTYQVKVRAYRTVSTKKSKGKTVKNTYYGNWSALRKIKVK